MLDPAANLVEYGPLPAAELDAMAEEAAAARSRGKAVVAWVSSSLGGAAGILGPGLTKPMGVRSAEELLVSLLTRQTYMRRVFEGQADVLIGNVGRVNARLGGLIDVVFYRGADFGTQKGAFFNPEIFQEVYSLV